MASKNTKGTRPRFTAKRSPSMDLRLCIEKRLAASESSWASFADRATGESRGERTERGAALWLERRGDLVFASRFQTPFAEVDILALSLRGSILLCEVKSSFWPDDRALGLGFRQKLRLTRAALWIHETCGRDVEILLLGPSTRSGHFLELPIF